jgi:predicted GNAT family N-acyltransferase
VLFRERLRSDHVLAHFRCGNELLDSWLKDSAINADRSGTGRTYVWLDDRGEVVAYFTLAPHLIRRSELPSSVGRGAPDVIPAVLLARLALAQRLQGTPERYGGTLLADALSVAVEAIAKAGGRIIVVDAMNDAARSFYIHHGFVEVPEVHGRLVIKASDAARSLGIAWP